MAGHWLPESTGSVTLCFFSVPDDNKIMVLNIAHRGARSLAPENTIAAARKAKEVGADIWETDIAVTSDEILILFHDNSLARTTDAPSRFPDRKPWIFTNFTFDEIRALDAGSWFVETDPFGLIASGELSDGELEAYKGEKIPSLEEALLFTQEANWCVNLELKRLPPPLEDFPVVERVLGLIDDLGIDESIVTISSFNHDWLRKVKDRKPGMNIHALIGYPGSESLDWGNLDFAVYNARSTLINEEQIRTVIKKGVTVNLFTVNDIADMKRFIEAGTAGLITDFPQRLASLLAEL